MIFGEKIKKARLEQFFTQKQMADELGVSALSIIRWENGQSNPSLAAQKKFHNAPVENKVINPTKREVQNGKKEKKKIIKALSRIY